MTKRREEFLLLAAHAMQAFIQKEDWGYFDSRAQESYGDAAKKAELGLETKSRVRLLVKRSALFAEYMLEWVDREGPE